MRVNVRQAHGDELAAQQQSGAASSSGAAPKRVRTEAGGIGGKERVWSGSQLAGLPGKEWSKLTPPHQLNFFNSNRWGGMVVWAEEGDQEARTGRRGSTDRQKTHKNKTCRPPPRAGGAWCPFYM